MLEFKNVKKTYQGKAGELPALDGLSFAALDGESVALIGPSGSGKTTALLMAAGLLAASEGSICVDGAPVRGPLLKTGLILQDYGLLPWKTVYENAELGLLLRKRPRAERSTQTHRILNQVGLEHFARSYPHELSGGMRQRLALARVLALDVDLLLMDEPLSALDLELRESLQNQLLELWRERGYTQVLVTHSIDEAVYLGERILVLGSRPGRIVAEITNPLMGSAEYRLMPEFFAKVKEVRQALLCAGAGATEECAEATTAEAATAGAGAAEQSAGATHGA